jgi:hypothetical protein
MMTCPEKYFHNHYPIVKLRIPSWFVNCRTLQASQSKHRDFIADVTGIVHVPPYQKIGVVTKDNTKIVKC